MQIQKGFLEQSLDSTVERRTSINVFVKLSTCAGIIERDVSRYRFQRDCQPRTFGLRRLRTSVLHRSKWLPGLRKVFVRQLRSTQLICKRRTVK